MAILPQSSTRWMGLWGRMYLGMAVRAWARGLSLVWGLYAVVYPWVGCAEIWLPDRMEGVSRDDPLWWSRVFPSTLVCSGRI